MLSKFSTTALPALGVAVLFLALFWLIHAYLLRQYGAVRAGKLSLIVLLAYTLFSLCLAFFVGEACSRVLILSTLCQIPAALIIIRQKGKA